MLGLHGVLAARASDWSSKWVFRTRRQSRKSTAYCSSMVNESGRGPLHAWQPKAAGCQANQTIAGQYWK
jgi:hypothetical protein